MGGKYNSAYNSSSPSSLLPVFCPRQSFRNVLSLAPVPPGRRMMAFDWNENVY